MSRGSLKQTLRLCFGGPAASVTTRRWVEWFASRGHDTTVITVEPARAPSFDQIDVRASAGPRKLGRLLSAVRMARTIRRLQPDVVHVHYARGLAWGLLLARFHPYVVMPWGSDILEEQGPFREWYSKRLTRTLLGNADLLTVPSDYLERRIRALLPTVPPLVRIGPGVNLPDAVVMVPRSDGLANSLLEAMACGAVPVLNRLPQYAELVSHGENGLLVGPEAQGDLVGALVGVLSDPGLKTHLAQANREKVMKEADQDQEMARMEEWYVRLTEAGRRRGSR